MEPNLEMLFAEVLSDPDACLRDGRFVELLGKAEVQQLVSAAKAILASRGGYVWPPQTTEYMETTLRLFVDPVLRDPDRARRLTETFTTLATERGLFELGAEDFPVASRPMTVEEAATWSRVGQAPKMLRPD